uniref:Pathogen-related protein n=1 Tax=Aegilops tauschii TaxID=37682 RepID=M8CF57_AEGTA
MASAAGVGDKYRSFLHGDGEKKTMWRNGAPPNYDLRPRTRRERMAIGGYNAFLATTLPPEHRIYDPDKESVESATSTFLTAFPRGFAIEVLDVYSGPPRIAFKFRHWGYMEGPFKGHPPHGQRVEFFGVCIFHVYPSFSTLMIQSSLWSMTWPRGAPHMAKINLCVYGVPPPPYIKEGRRRRAGHKGRALRGDSYS